MLKPLGCRPAAESEEQYLSRSCASGRALGSQRAESAVNPERRMEWFATCMIVIVTGGRTGGLLMSAGTQNSFS